MGEEIIAPAEALALLAIIIIVPVALTLVIGVPSFDLPTNIVIIILTGFVIGLFDRRFLNDNILLVIISGFFFLVLVYLINLRWFYILLIYLGGLLLAKKTVKRKMYREADFR